MYIADLHIHSRYSRATSRDCTPEYLDLWARKKGIHILGTGDFTHPAWRQELEEKLIPAEEGLYRLKEDFRLKGQGPQGMIPRFVISGEISSIYKKNDRVRKVHNVILLPSLQDAEALSKKLEAIGNIHSDGRPILGLDSRDLLEITLEVCPRAIFVPAHIWTPHFSMFGAFSGFDTVEECFEDLTPHIRAVETGLSSDPPMNWRLSALDRFQLISNSDAHSPSKLGREANLLDIHMGYEGLYGAIQEGRGLAGTIEFFPEEGKYHFDGHRKCHLCLSPREAQKYHGKCPVCGRKLTLGVSHRVEQMADREDGFVSPGARPFESLVPLPEVIGASTGHSFASARVQKIYEHMLGSLGTEFAILREIDTQEIQKEAGYLVAEGIRRLRRGKVQRFPGFDGEYGTIKLFEPAELEAMDGQITMSGWVNLDRGREALSETAASMEFPLSEGIMAPEAATALSEPLAPGEPAEEELNEEQLQAVRAIAPRMAVKAGPGTGKTKTLVFRILYLLRNRKVKSTEITAVTFTNKAAGEIRERLEQQMGGRRLIRNLQTGTFHSICFELLKKQGREFTLADEETVLELVREAAEELGIKESPVKLRQAISRRKTDMGNPVSAEGYQEESTADSHMEQLAVRYQESLAAMNALDFDDLLLEALRLAEDGKSGVWDKEARAFSYLLIDEFQDISPLQYRLIKAWSKKGREIFIIGDPDQAIYGFRGADSKSFDRFCEEEKAEVICLKKNYRSTPEILGVSKEILKKPEGFLEPVAGSGISVRMAEAASDMGEAIFTAKEINRLVGGIDMLDIQEGPGGREDRKVRSFGDIAVLYRTHRQSELLEKCLKKEGIPYVVTGREEFLEKDMVRGSLGFFRSILNPEDRLSKQVCLRLLWSTDEDYVSRKYQEMAEKYGKLCKKGKPQTILRSWRKDMNLEEDEGLEKLSAMAVFYKTMGEMTEAIAFGRESDLRRWGGKAYTSDCVTLMTLHGSKGLEFPAVLLYGAKKGMVPLELKGRQIDVEEERRLFYVGVTRAREELIITSSGEASVFLEAMPDTILTREKIRQKNDLRDQGQQMSLFDFMK